MATRTPVDMAAVYKPLTSELAFRTREAATLQACTQRGVVIYMWTDSINDHSSVDGRYGSWHGSMQARMDRTFQVPRVQALLDQTPTPVVAGLEGYVLRTLSFENHLAKYSVDVANTFGMTPYKSGGMTGALQHGTGLQATFQSGGSVRGRKDLSTGQATYVATQKIGDKYKVTSDGVTIAEVTATTNGLKWRKHETMNLPLAEHTMEVQFLSGTMLFNSIDGYIGTERAGIRVYNGGRSGVSLNSFAKSGAGSDVDQKWKHIFPLLADDGKSGVDIGILTLSTNNMGDDVDVFYGYIVDAVTAWFEVNPNSILHISFPAQPDVATLADWRGKHQAAKKAASEIPWVSVDSLWDGEVAGRIPQIKDDSKLINGLHPKSPLYLGDKLAYGYGKTMASIVDGSAFTGKTLDPGTGTGTPNPGTGGGTPADTTKPTVTLVDGQLADRTLSEGGTTPILADITDASGIGIVSVRSTAGDAVGTATLVSGTRYRYDLTYDTARSFLGATGTVLRCFLVAYDKPGNRQDTGAFNINVPLRSAKTPPTLTNPNLVGLDVANSDITANVVPAHSSGVASATIRLDGATESFDFVKPTAAGATRWSVTIDRSKFQQAGGSYVIEAYGADGAYVRSSAIAYGALAGTPDTTGPRGYVTKPVTSTTLPASVDLEAFAVDTQSGVASVIMQVEDRDLAELEYAGASLFAGTVPRQAIADIKPTGARMRAKLTDREGNITYTDWVFYSLPADQEDEGADYDGLFLAWLDSKTLLPAEPAVLAAWRAAMATASGDGGTGTSGLVARDTDGRLIDTQSK